MKRHLVFIILFIYSYQGLSQGLIINELMSSNQKTILDQYGDSSDWIEIYNSSSESINLEDYSLSDDIKDTNKWLFPNIELPPSQFLLVFCSGKNTYKNNELHTNFKIQQSGEALFLFQPDQTLISYMPSIYLPTDYSYGCVVDGGDVSSIMELSSPGTSNSLSITLNQIESSHQSGFYNSKFELELISNYKESLIYYTLDGSTPTTNDFLYTAPILIQNNTNNINLIPTTPLKGAPQLSEFIWLPAKNINKASILRFGAFQNDSIQGSVQSRIYFIGDDFKKRYKFPIISLITDSLNLFDYEDGIYIPGKTFDDAGFLNSYWPVGNYHNRGIEWEKNVHISYFEHNLELGFETNAGMRIRGFGSASFPQKSLNIYFREEYGLSSVNYPIFLSASTETNKRLILRNSGNDFLSTHFKDALLQDLVSSADLETQKFRPSVVFLNGEYWGIHNIREKYDRHYFKYNYMLDEDSINVINLCGSEIEDGDIDNYFEIVDFVENNDLSIEKNYDFFTQNIDVENFIDFLITEIYYANYDWPCNNYKLWKSSSDTSKWRFLMYDLDYTFGHNERSDYTALSLNHATSLAKEWPHCPCSNLFFRKALENTEFKSQFINRFLFHLKNTFSSAKVLSKIEEYQLLFEPEITEHIDRWGYPNSMMDWYEKIYILKEFAINRPCFISTHIIKFFDLKDFDFDCDEINQQNYEFNIYPNPNDGQVKVLTNFPISDIKQLSIYDIMGNIVYQENDCSFLLNNEQVLDLDFLSNGLYSIYFSTTNFYGHKKLLIVK